MYRYEQGRNALLGFYQRLTPQTLLFAIVFYIGASLNFEELDLSNWAKTSIFFIGIIIVLMLSVANWWVFYEELCVSMRCIRLRRNLLDRRHPKKGEGWRICYMIRWSWKKKRSVYFEHLFFVVIVLSGYVTVFFSSAVAAVNLYELIHK